ncbi:alpha/beta hydrolase [Plantactinospora sp. S1510]|uniref:Alpha/beta hydrolase n=1 Tax=Plantactinospora alkalitolerans TaxID=2789879 RepID=A0ABS0H6Y8_9ACTN|nr:alpha/beta hydrolase [Plantactinospora alkalitolerans]MBF9134056.1 alpha/beta hydrolase [Plantactinospora alkalitolerans]
MTTTQTTTGLLPVPGATIHYEMRGTGPLLLISQSGEGDADRSDDLVDDLAVDHTVLTYDRRGLSRSTLDEPGGQISLPEHADDVHRLLASLTTEPVDMLGCSFGALIGLHLAARHPRQLRLLVAHEPVAPWLLPATERARHERELFDIQRLYRAEGLPAAIRKIAGVLGIDPADKDVEPDLTPQPMTPQRIANFDVFIERDFTAAVRDVLDVAALTGLTTLTGPRIVPAVGRTTGERVFDRRCAEELARLLGTDPVEFPGGHNGNTSHPRGYARQLRDILRAAR